MSEQKVVLSKDIERLGGEIVARDVDGLGVLRIRVRMPNGYGASIIGGGLLTELTSAAAEGAVIVFDEDGDSDLVYDTSVTDDVVRFHAVSEIVEFLDKIAELPARRKAVGE